ncbi:hypothetical protein SNE40_010331 [Patella caerulea]|uniref:Molybdopterin molybdenumtransferase n=1 Tax=Patella caerulea TaxID=87958 RepID=A0AAN8K0U0_PATCE
MTNSPHRVGLLMVEGVERNTKDVADRKEKMKKIIQKHPLLSNSILTDDCTTCETSKIQAKLCEWCDSQKFDVVLTFGGVELSPLDIVPEVTRGIIEREALYLTVALIKKFLDSSPLTVLSRGICGIRGSTLIINLTNDSKQLENCLDVICPCLEQIIQSLKQPVTPHKIEFIDNNLRIEQTEAEEPKDYSYGSHIDIPPDKSLVEDFTKKPEQSILDLHVFEDDGSDEVEEIQTDELDKIENIVPVSEITACHEISKPVPQNLCLKKSPYHTRKQSFKNSIRADAVSSDLSNLHNNNKDGNEPATCSQSEKKTSENEAVTKLDTGTIVSDAPNDKSGNNKPESLQQSSVNEDVYRFDSYSESEEEIPPTKGKKTSSKKREKGFKKARIYHNHDRNKEICFIPVGEAMIDFLKSHPSIKDIYLNKGKRHVKKNLVTLKRQESAIDKASWERKGHKLERNRFDDYFEVTDEGEKKKEEIGRCQARDEYVVNWYVWCPGHGNCMRKCGGYGKCKEGCSGMAHKQDRHNCSFLVNFKIFLSDLTKWRVQMTGCHVPDDSTVPWVPPDVAHQRMNQNTRDFIISQFEAKNVSTSNVQEAFIKEQQNPSSTVLSKRKISRVMWGLKKRKSDRKSSSKQTVTLNASVASQSESTENITVISIPSTCQSNNIAQSSSLSSVSNTNIPSTVNQSFSIKMDQPKVIIINQDLLTRVTDNDPSNIDVSELIQNSEIPDGEMSNSDLRAVLLSLYNQQ